MTKGKMKSAVPQLRRRMAKDEIVLACDGLTVPEALGALLEIAAQILVDHGITPGTEEFDSFMVMLARSLPPRVAQLRREALATASERQAGLRVEARETQTRYWTRRDRCSGGAP